jgi:1,2-diacylglycerol 3-alpha-glucosyltransferase
MKVLITTDWYEPVVNGVVVSVLNLKEELQKAGHDVKILTLSPNHFSYRQDEVYYISSWDVRRIYPQARVAFFIRSRYVKELVKWKPDVIHSQCEFSSFLFARHIAKKTGAPIVHTYHTIYEDYQYMFIKRKIGKKMVKLYSRKLLNNTQAVIAPTEKVKNLLKRYGVHQEIYTIPTGIDTKNFSWEMSEEEKQHYKQKLGIPLEKKILLFVGRLAQEKNIQELLRYYKKLNREDVILLLVGDGPYREEIEKEVEKLELTDRVYFTGMVPKQQVASYYHLGDIFVCSSNTETQGLTYAEALASGLPCVCRKDECLTGIIVDGYNGYQYEDEQDFCEKISLILDNAKETRLMAMRARFSSRKLSKQCFSEKIEKVYEEKLQEEELQYTCNERVFQKRL